MARQKKLQELTIKDNFMFSAVMVNEENCRRFLELVLGFPIAHITVSKEKSLVYDPLYKGVRLDIIAKDEARTHYNVEMQMVRKPKLGKRSRYYHSQLDMEILFRGEDYDALPDAYVIFICDYDPFGKKKYCYTFDMRCKEDDTLFLGDGSHTLFLSTCGTNEDEVPRGLVNFLKFVKAGLNDETAEFEDDFVRRLQNEVRYIKESREMEERYMTLQEWLQEERMEGFTEGRAEGRVEALAEYVLEILRELDGVLSEELREKILSEKEEDILKNYLKIASRVRDITEFTEQISE